LLHEKMGRLGELKQRAHSPLAAGLASESKLDSIPYRGRFKPINFYDLALKPSIQDQEWGE
jgi:hypothetical protein